MSHFKKKRKKRNDNIILKGKPVINFCLFCVWKKNSNIQKGKVIVSEWGRCVEGEGRKKLSPTPQYFQYVEDGGFFLFLDGSCINWYGKTHFVEFGSVPLSSEKSRHPKYCAPHPLST